tara:strand:+ start:20851 stop:21000 length:150 start_codon:yes stop_codon:yes gene_type:complete
MNPINSLKKLLPTSMLAFIEGRNKENTKDFISNVNSYIYSDLNEDTEYL